MDKITLRNFRCFREEQAARVAPLTLLVGENSTGKTSFMAMIRALWDVAYRNRVPDFKEKPYDLGSFDEIVYNRSDKNGRENIFEAGFDSTNIGGGLKHRTSNETQTYHFNVTFRKDGTAPVPMRRRLASGKLWIEESLESEDQCRELRIGTERGSWDIPVDPAVQYSPLYTPNYLVWPLFIFLPEIGNRAIPLNGSKEITKKDIKQLHDFCDTNIGKPAMAKRPYASAPVRSKPRRTYDPALPSSDPEGDYIPMYLADMSLRHEKEWKVLKNNLENFGQDSGLFDEITVKHLGKTLGSPFQLQIRKFEGRRKGPWRNLIDVGYGVSQILPLIAELLSQDMPPLILLQQPEVHLHPSARASLGSLFCQVAAPNHQLIVETHSDYILDRVRMEVRDNNVPLKPEDVSILFFERRAQDVCIHSLGLDKEGNISGDVPPNYRNFFMEESQRLWGL